MSGSTFSYAYVEQLIAQQHAQAQAATGSGGGLQFPYFSPTPGSSDQDVDTQWTGATSFNTSMYNSDGSLMTLHQIIDRFNAIMQYSANGDTMDYNSIMDATAIVMNIGAIWGKLTDDEKAQLTDLLNLKVTGPNGNSETIVDLVTQIGIPCVIEGTYWYNNGDQSKTMSMAQQLISTLNTIVTGDGCSRLAPMLQYAQSLYGNNGSTLQDWMDQNPPGKMSFNTFALGMAFEWQTAFACNSGAGQYLDSIRGLELNDLLAGVTDPFKMYIIIMYVLMDETNDSQTAIAGQGNLTNYLSVPMGANAKEIANAWSSGQFTTATAQTFFSEVMALEAFSNNTSIASIKPQLDELYQALTNPNSATQINVTFQNSQGLQETSTIAALYQAAIKAPAGSNAWSDLVDAMNSLQPTSTNYGKGSNGIPNFPTQPGYATLTNLVQQVTNALTSKSTAVGQILQYNEGTFEKQLSFIQATAEECVNVNKTINQNMAQAGA